MQRSGTPATVDGLADVSAAAGTPSVLELFSIGLGPSSSHTVGPMRAARRFAEALGGATAAVARLEVTLYGSLALTGAGHGTDAALLVGLEGARPESVDPDGVAVRVAAIHMARSLRLLNAHAVEFDEARDLRRVAEPLPRHPNAMRLRAFAASGAVVAERIYYSVGGGVVIGDGERDDGAHGRVARDGGGRDSGEGRAPYPFSSGDELLRRCRDHGLRISDVVLANESAGRPADEVRHELLRRWQVMADCIERGWRRDGLLPGGLRVRRRARSLRDALSTAGLSAPQQDADPLRPLDWAAAAAMAVNEENAAGGRVVTAPTNGAAGIVPAVLYYYRRFLAADGPGADAGTVRFLLTAGAFGLVIRRAASISGAEVGCQGEIGSACAMAAAGLCEVLGGTPEQVENAAEIGMEHNLGLTCDPVGGLVQVPCIERNAIGTTKAIAAARLALVGDGRHRVSFDQVVATMRATGADMKAEYRETSRGGLSVAVAEC